MKINMQQWKISTKLYSSFSIVTLIVIVAAILGYRNINLLTDKTTTILRSAPLVDSAMEMKVAVATDIKEMMSMAVAENGQQLGQNWKRHQDAVLFFDEFTNAILNGADTKEGTIYKATDKGLRDIVSQADKYHDERLQPAIKTVFNHSTKIQEIEIDAEKSMRAMENSFDHIISMAESLEAQIKEVIERRIKSGTTAKNILETESPWADMAMEMKTTLAMSRIVIEEYAQLSESANRRELIEKYQEHTKEFFAWVNALLYGASTREGLVLPIYNEKLRPLVLNIEKTYKEEFQKTISNFISMIDNIKLAKQQRKEAQINANQVGNEMLDLLSNVEELAKAIMATAEQESHTATTYTKTVMIAGLSFGTVLAALLAILIPPTITRPLGGEPHEIKQLADKIANGDLTSRFKDEDNAIGAYASMIVMNNKLNQLIAKLIDSSSSLASTATQTSSISEETNSNVQQQNQQTESIATAIEQMSVSVQEVANNANDTSAIANLSADETSNGKQMVQEMSNTIKILSGEIDKATQVILSLQQESESIGSVSEVISGIAEQTNLLALNAAIEAARAGEQGRGFAVVADEVRSLASKTQESIANIDSIIASLQSGSKHAVEVMENSQKRAQETMQQGQQSALAIQNITEKVIKINNMNAHIATAAREQASVTNEISSNIQYISQIAQNNSMSSQNIVEAGEELAQQAEMLKSMAEKFKVA